VKILIDTNILIHLEDNKVINEKFAQFYRLAISNQCKILYHPKAIPFDLNKDKDIQRKNITTSKLKKYEKLENYAILSNDFNNKIGFRKDNDKIDNKQLYQLYKGYVDYFITQDKGIHEKAKSINLSKKVLNVVQILELLEDKYTIKIPSHPILKEHSIREIENKFKDSFFDSLRNDYGTEYFNKWLKKCAQENRKCYTLQVDNEIRAILIYNLEDIKDHQISGIYEKMLKICTLKVADTVFGVKLGELFINKMFEYCLNQRIKYLYLTVYDKQEHLIKLLEKFGFYRRTFINKQGLEEIQMIKELDKSKIKIKQNIVSNHPFYTDNIEISKFAIPIQPNYYSNLFKDGELREPTLFDYSLDSVNEIQGNTIIKAYISNSKITNLKPGDLLLFYASKTSKVIEPVGILESINIVNNFEDLWKIVNKKTVFSQNELQNMLNEKQKLNVITFRLVTYLKKKVNLPKISKLDSFKNKIQTITRISETDYQTLKDEEYFDRRYIID
jgi:predicted GNAT family N-acyltransferase/predicted RNA-binding protein with PUA-like domain